MTEIIFIRHAQAEGNAARILHGFYNSLLTEKGHLQADAAGKFLSDKKIDVIYSSDLTRTYMTALHVAAYQGCDIIKNAGLRENFAGDWENVSFEYIMKTFPEEYAAWQNDTGTFAFPNGESVEEMTVRVGDTVRKIAEENDGKTVAVVSHATPIRSLRCYFENLPVSEMKNHPWPSNASVSIADYSDGKLSFKVYDEHSFLSDIM